MAWAKPELKDTDNQCENQENDEVTVSRVTKGKADISQLQYGMDKDCCDQCRWRLQLQISREG